MKNYEKLIGLKKVLVNKWILLINENPHIFVTLNVEKEWNLSSSPCFCNSETKTLQGEIRYYFDLKKKTVIKKSFQRKYEKHLSQTQISIE